MKQKRKSFMGHFVNEGVNLWFTYKDLKGNKKCYSEPKEFIL